jgi:hypothetical protein
MRKRLARYETLLWRTGDLGRTIHAVIGSIPTEHDPLIGCMDTKLLADAVVRDHNTAMLKLLADRVE